MASNPLERDDHPPERPAVAWIELAQQVLVFSRTLREKLIHRAEQWQIGEGEFFLLWSCRNTPPPGLGQNELAAAMAVSPAQVSELVERLRQKGLLEGQRDPSDRRRQLWRLTAAGQRTLQTVMDDLAGWTAQRQTPLPGQHVDTLVGLLGRATAALESPPTELASRRGAA